jgi:hypothetical protein
VQQPEAAKILTDDAQGRAYTDKPRLILEDEGE